MLIFSIILATLSIGFGTYCMSRLRRVQKKDSETEKINQELAQKKAKLIKAIDTLALEKRMLEDTIRDKKEVLQSNESILEDSFSRYVQVLENKYKANEEEYDNLQELLKKAYDDLQTKLMEHYKDKDTELGKDFEKTLKDIEVVKEQLKKLQDTRAAMVQAQLREEEIKNQLTFHSLPIDKNDLSDIEILESIKPRLAKPRILSMLIWSTFFQKPMTTLCNNIIGPKIKTGIYKITNQKNNMCYIGQAVDIATRWKEHAKFGLGIDTPANNKLYQAIVKDGIWNFTWEVLEECDKTLLNEKERNYIEIYQSNIYGYNSTAGNKK